MKYAVLIGEGLVNNNIFDLSSPANRDNCFKPYAILKERFSDFGIDLRTPDMCKNEKVEFELHQDVQRGRGYEPAYLLLFETPFVRPSNSSARRLSSYRKVFTWDDSLITKYKYEKINFPNNIVVPEINGFDGRSIFCSMVSGNKSVSKHDPRELYSERVSVIRWFEHYAPDDFKLYGAAWNLPAAKPGLLGKVEQKLWLCASRCVPIRPFPSYQGRVKSKYDVLRKSKFSICYENVRDLPGYITEKVFDCFFSGCVPVYWGASNIEKYIPSDCFVDRRKFSDTRGVYEFLKHIDEPIYLGYQKRIADYLLSKAANQFSSEFFAETVVSTIVRDRCCES